MVDMFGIYLAKKLREPSTLHCQINGGGGDASRFLTFFPPEDAY